MKLVLCVQQSLASVHIVPVHNTTEKTVIAAQLLDVIAPFAMSL